MYNSKQPAPPMHFQNSHATRVFISHFNQRHGPGTVSMNTSSFDDLQRGEILESLPPVAERVGRARG